jgi:Uncharacterized protein conserved in archaea
MKEEDLRIFEEIAGITEKSVLADALACELARYSVYDIMKMRARLDSETNQLPPPYRENVRPYFIEWQIGRYMKLMEMRSNGGFHGLTGTIENLELYREFCAMETRRLKEWDETEQDEDDWYNPFHSRYYLLLSCFYMFVLGEPGHPVGMPFPGGFKVEKRPDAIYCPIREKEKEVEYSICNFCPARQDENNL